VKIILHDFGRHAFPVQLSRVLAQRGHEVLHLYAGQNNTPMGNLAKQPSDPVGFSSAAITTSAEYQKYSYLKRWQQERKYARRLAEIIREQQPDVVIECTGPTDGHLSALRASHQIGAKYIFWLQDINGVAAYNLLKKKIPVLGSIIGKYYIRMEKTILRQSDQVVLISEDFKPIMQEWGICPEKLHVIPNWAPIDLLPVRPKVNDWSIQHGFTDKFCFIYTGSLGLKHNPELFIKLAQHFSTNDQVRVVVISEGLGAEWLKGQAKAVNLANLHVLDYQAFENLPVVMGSADVLVSVLQPNAGVFSVPSKVNSYLCAGRPLLLAVPPENLAARMVLSAGAGLTVHPLETEGFIGAAVGLFSSEELRKTASVNARKFAEEHFDIAGITDQFERIIS
jgi:colanic acid biosynthesis glycosyl transferase WcaI